MSDPQDPQAPPDPAPPDAETPGRPRFNRYLAVFGAVLLSLSLLVGAANHRLDSINYSTAFQGEVAEALLRGQSFAVVDPNLDFRALRREHLRRMPATPDVIIFAGSRFQEATADTIPFDDASFYNAFAHNDYYEDCLAIGELLIELDRLPKILVLGVRYRSFMPLSARPTEEWKSFAPEYRAMADKLGVEKVGWLDSAPISFWTTMVSIPALARNTDLWWQHRAAPPGPTAETSHEVFDVLHPDGSIGFSTKHQGTWTKESARADSEARAKKARKQTLPVDRARVEGLKRLLPHLQERGTHVVLAMTPHHPLYWSRIIDSPYGQTLAAIEREMVEIGGAQGVPVIGSFDAGRAGCPEETFLDYIHFTNDCLKAVFRGIPPLHRKPQPR